MGNTHKRIVCDIDDTISFTLNRDWEHATPNIPVINKINQLYDMGWEIYLVTARGSLSCKTREEAYGKYAPQIKTWLQKHGVKYHQLSFEKYLAAYYIDDKSLTPEQFANLDIRVLKAGWSGAHVELRDGRVYKTHTDSIAAAAWYEIAKHFVHVPQIHSLIGQTLCMEYIEEDGSPVLLPQIVAIITELKSIDVENTSMHFEAYIERIKNHLEYEKTYKRFKLWLTAVRYIEDKITLGGRLNYQSSFCHGDLTLENILVQGDKHFLIDPIYEPDKITWSSWLLDVSKLLYSLRRHNMMREYAYLYRKANQLLNDTVLSNYSILHLLELSHIIRVYKYAPDTERQQLRNLFDTVLDEFEQNIEHKIS